MQEKPKAPLSDKESGRIPMRFVTPYEVATTLRISQALVSVMVKAGKIPATRIGRLVRIPKAWLDAQ